ncbi:MAG: hypothetical protein AAGG46_05870, partial [Planctomycetota bacterium]
RPQRAAGALVVLLEGRLTAYVGRTGRRLTTFLADDEPQRSRDAERLAAALAERASRRGSMLLEKVDGAGVESSVLAGALSNAGFAATSRGYVHRTPRDA